MIELNLYPCRVAATRYRTRDDKYAYRYWYKRHMIKRGGGVALEAHMGIMRELKFLPIFFQFCLIPTNNHVYLLVLCRASCIHRSVSQLCHPIDDREAPPNVFIFWLKSFFQNLKVWMWMWYAIRAIILFFGRRKKKNYKHNFF